MMGEVDELMKEMRDAKDDDCTDLNEIVQLRGELPLLEQELQTSQRFQQKVCHYWQALR